MKRGREHFDEEALGPPNAAQLHATPSGSDPNWKQIGPEQKDECWDIPTETSIIIDLILGLGHATCPRAVWVHQLYALIPNRTLVDKELDEMRRSRTIRVLNTPLGQAVMKSEHFFEDLRGPSTLAQRCRYEAWLRLSDNISASRAQLCAGTVDPLSNTDVDTLISEGYLSCRRDILSSDVFWIAHPGINMIITSMISVRKELLSAISRTRYKELNEGDLIKKKSKSFICNPKFYLYDLIGSGSVDLVRTATGNALYRLRRMS